MQNRIVLLLSMTLLFGCASTHTGDIAESQEKAIVISVDENKDLSDKYYMFFEYTIENTSADWKDIQIIEAGFKGHQTEILVDQQLASWIEGAEHKLRAAQYNRDLLIGSMVVAGGVVAGTSSNASTQNAGAAVMASGALAGVGTSIQRAHVQATTGTKGVNGTVNVPSTHIFVPTKVAPESYVRRWVVLKRPEVKSPQPSPEDSFESRADKVTWVKLKLVSKAKIDSKTERDFIVPVKYMVFQD